MTSPVGDHAAQLAAIKISEGFNLGYCKAKPGHGPEMHNHDTNETFIPMTGTWRASWENEKGEVEFVDLGPLDVVSFPPGMIRRFENVTKGDPNEESILMFVIGGEAPQCGVHGSGDGALAEGGSLVARTGLEGAGHDCRDVDWRTGSGDGRDLCRRGRLCQRRRTARAARSSTRKPC